MTPKTALFVQARLDSSRFPAKALSVLGGISLLEQVLLNLRPIHVDLRVLVCDSDSLSVFKGIAERSGYECFAGDKDNVLSRFIAAAEHYQVSIIVRATADNPLVCVRAAQSCLDEMLVQQADHCRMDGLPYGGGVEVVRTQALLQVADSNPGPREREHVCPGVWEHPDRFKLIVLQAPDFCYYPNVRLTLDTFDDYRTLSAYFSGLGSAQASFEDFLDKEGHRA